MEALERALAVKKTLVVLKKKPRLLEYLLVW
jgi:hypothetical protein